MENKPINTPPRPPAAPTPARLIGLEEIVLAVALTLIAIGVGMIYAPLAAIAPGLVLLWLALPARAGFVVRPPAHQTVPPKRERR